MEGVTPATGSATATEWLAAMDRRNRFGPRRPGMLRTRVRLALLLALVIFWPALSGVSVLGLVPVPAFVPVLLSAAVACLPVDRWTFRAVKWAAVAAGPLLAFCAWAFSVGMDVADDYRTAPALLDLAPLAALGLLGCALLALAALAAELLLARTRTRLRTT
ncbi:hypothetical protein [Kytococcus sedentarius]|uniref:hypothetical protein n=1 Tax=Kytococcus sedentarius TaxID=1276 RepID=UPI0035BBBB41